MTSLCKLYTAKCAVFCVSEGIECLGAIGYLETSEMSRIFRDVQVLSVWEGTTNVLGLDILRVLNHKINGSKTLNDTQTLDQQLSILKRLLLFVRDHVESAIE